jgi:hypothetical protein
MVGMEIEDLPEAVTDSEGRFAIPGLPAGAFELVIEHSRGIKKVISGDSLRNGETKSLEVEIEASGGVRGIIKSGRTGTGGVVILVDLNHRMTACMWLPGPNRMC